MTGTCDDCDHPFSLITLDRLKETTVWEQWGESGGQQMKIKKQGLVEDALEELNKQWKYFKTHMYM